jgi:hypothetical protein
MKAIALTPYRAAVLRTLRARHAHPTAAEIYRLVRRRRLGVAFATIYNALHWLTRRGLVAELKFGHGASRYDPIIRRHDHRLCMSCGVWWITRLPCRRRSGGVRAAGRGFASTATVSNCSVFAPAAGPARRLIALPEAQHCMAIINTPLRPARSG